MSDRDARAKTRGNSKPNVKRRGSTYTYHVYVTGPNGKRRQHSKGGFKTQREAEAARVAALHALSTGTHVKAERITTRGRDRPPHRPQMLDAAGAHALGEPIVGRDEIGRPSR